MPKVRGTVKSFLRMLKLVGLPSKEDSTSVSYSIENILAKLTDKGIEIAASNPAHTLGTYLIYKNVTIEKKGEVLIDIPKMLKFLKRFGDSEEITIDFKDRIYVTKEGVSGDFKALDPDLKDSIDIAPPIKWVKKGKQRFPIAINPEADNEKEPLNVILKFKPERFGEVLKDTDALKAYRYTFNVVEDGEDSKVIIKTEDSINEDRFQRNIIATVIIDKSVKLPISSTYSPGIYGVYTVLKKECITYFAKDLTLVVTQNNEEYNFTFVTAPIIESEDEEEIEELEEDGKSITEAIEETEDEYEYVDDEDEED